jgi:hypothetical protein
MSDLNRATEVTPEVEAEIQQVFDYAPWTREQVEHGAAVRQALAEAFRALLVHVPPCPDRSHAQRLLRDARMWANSAITHGGKY